MTPRFLGLPEEPPADAPVDVAILPLPFERTVSYGTGTAAGPGACLEASAQVELHDPLLDEELPAGRVFRTVEPWASSGGSVADDLASLTAYLVPWFRGECFPLVLGGEHGILPPLLRALSRHPAVEGDLSRVTVVQIDAHADLREDLDGERWSHACAASRALDLGVGRLLQVGIRAYCRQEAEASAADPRVTTFYARDLLAPSARPEAWRGWLEALASVRGPTHLTIDIDGLDGSLVPATGTPVPGGLSLWHAFETIEALFANPRAEVLSADVNEIATRPGCRLTEFTAAMLATKCVAAHIAHQQPRGQQQPRATEGGPY